MNIVRTVARKSSNRLKFCWLKVICCICQSNELEREIKQKTGGKRGASQKSGGTVAHRIPLQEPTLWRYHCSVTYVTRQWRSYHENFSFIVTYYNVTGNDNASQNESKWKFQWRKRRTVLFSQSEEIVCLARVTLYLGRPCNSLFEFQVVHRYVFIVV